MPYFILDTKQGSSFLLTDSPAGPVITSISPNPFKLGETITVTLGEEMIEGLVVVSNGDYESIQDVLTWVAADGITTLTFVAEGDGLPFIGNLLLTIHPDQALPITSSLTIEPEDGYYAVVINNPSIEEGSVLLEFTGSTPINGFQIEWSDSPNTTVNPDGTFEQVIPNTFQVRVWDSTDNTRGTFADITIPDGIFDVNAGDPIVAGEEFFMTLIGVNQDDVGFVRILEDSKTWTLPVDSVETIGESVNVYSTAPEGLVSGSFVDVSVYENKAARIARG